MSSLFLAFPSWHGGVWGVGEGMAAAWLVPNQSLARALPREKMSFALLFFLSHFFHISFTFFSHFFHITSKTTSESGFARPVTRPEAS